MICNFYIKSYSKSCFKHVKMMKHIDMCRVCAELNALGAGKCLCM